MISKWHSIAAVALISTACSGAVNGIDLQQAAGRDCSIDNSEIFSGGPGKDGIPALTNPTMVEADGPGTAYLGRDDRVIGFELGGQALAIPLNILWWHEIANIDQAGIRLAVTHCPLTGSSIVFDRSAADGAEFGVSGLLYQNNLIMYDRNAEESLWPQMARSARCGPKDGLDLEMYPAIEMSWDGWQTLHPQTLVVSSNTDIGRNYRVYPYDDYDRIDNANLLFPLASIDQRRPPKERTLGIPDGDGGRAYPYGLLQDQGSIAAIQEHHDVIFWDSQRQAAMAYYRVIDGDTLDFYVEAGRILDVQTGSQWRVDGLAIAGPLSGKRLDPVAEAYVSYWFAWAAFQPDATLWSPR